jgi:hypothetical protein
MRYACYQTLAHMIDPDEYPVIIWTEQDDQLYGVPAPPCANNAIKKE